MFCMDVFLHKLVYEGIKRSEWKNFLREGEDMKKFGKKIAGFLLAAVLAVTAAFPAFAASKTAVGKIYLTIDSTVGLKNDSEDVTVTPYGDNTDLYYVDNIYIENNDGNGYTESNPPKITVTLEVADEDNYYFSGTASKDFRLTLSDSAKNGYGKAEYVKAVKKNDRSTVEPPHPPQVPSRRPQVWPGLRMPTEREYGQRSAGRNITSSAS